ncbi:MAG: YggT family protein [Gammaproteobacteria bacterium]|nr:YggT family protein [Gammaproteobacteria bacterium]
MGGGHIAEAIGFLISTLFGLYLVAVILRFLLQYVRADFYNPVSQFVVALTNPPLRPLRRLIPGYRGIDWPCLVLMLILKIIELSLLGLVYSGRLLAPAGLFVLSIAELLNLVVYIFIFAVLIQVVLSWVNPDAYNPVTVIVHRLTDPLLRPARRLVPPVGGLDFSPIVVLIALQLVVILIIRPLTDLGRALAH